jgi:hypothetical protein
VLIHLRGRRRIPFDIVICIMMPTHMVNVFIGPGIGTPGISQLCTTMPTSWAEAMISGKTELLREFRKM